MQTYEVRHVFDKLSKYKIVPVIRADSQEIAHNAVSTLKAVGFQTAEITLTVPGAIDLITHFSKREDLLVGAGTVKDLRNAEECIKAGAQYIISPLIVDGLPELCKEAGVCCIMSGLTPNEVYYAWRKGSNAVKVFPANSAGGPGHVKALKSVLPDIPLVPTGGVNLENINAFFDAGASFVGVGSDLVNKHLLEEGNSEEVANLGRKFLDKIF
ncbi:bifunctional 4-hydroxy-2-oxoglutarate aldolase/2-dehydro-3-deoxy-phosphogluconate aldolase [Bacillus sp. 2205SS5-2]|uniref:bifunctional 4-hydroxy-2-oxoglutarate aldolase/2-dehydro-3-deoxy-phosphogluconate aldolase n=1 Tax=Bacillus sp. 2205SS5-2 TaxID=3109031 RepID=UPI0030046442